ncbi:MAG: hypothetical protein AAF206_14315 [Bacteroidota bacterium]
MIRNSHTETPIFGAPLLPGSTSWIQKYYRLSRWLTIPTLLVLAVVLIALSDTISGFWISVIAIAVPINFIVFHALIAKVFAKMDQGEWHKHKLYISRESLTIYSPEKEIETFYLKDLSNIRWIYSGYERAFFPQGKHFSGSSNELHFNYRTRKVSLRFRLVSVDHFQVFRSLIDDWYEWEIPFEEYNQTSGLPVNSHRLRV